MQFAIYKRLAIREGQIAEVHVVEEHPRTLFERVVHHVEHTSAISDQALVKPLRPLADTSEDVLPCRQDQARRAGVRDHVQEAEKRNVQIPGQDVSMLSEEALPEEIVEVEHLL